MKRKKEGILPFKQLPDPWRKTIVRTCAYCHREIIGFKDVASQAENRISGLCQICQDLVYEGPGRNGGTA